MGFDLDSEKQEFESKLCDTDVASGYVNDSSSDELHLPEIPKLKNSKYQLVSFEHYIANVQK